MQTPVPTTKTGIQKIRLVYFDDLTSAPVIHDFDKVVKSANVRKMSLADVRTTVARDECEVALLPVSDALKLSNVSVVPCSAVSLMGPSRLFMIFSKVIPADIKRVLVDSEDYGSGLLAQLLFSKKLMIRPEFVKSVTPLDPAQYDLSGRDGYDAYLLVGKNAMATRKDVFTFTWDLTLAWYEFSKLPYVLHCWIAKKGLRLGKLDKEIGDVARRNDGSSDVSTRTADRFAVSSSSIRTIYERALHTEFDNAVVTGMRRYAQEMLQGRIVQFPPMTIYTEPVVRRPVGI